MTDGLVRTWTGAFRALLRLLPEAFRHEWLSRADAELEELLERLAAERGWWAVTWAGWCACWDVARAIPREWQAALRRRHGRGARGGGPGMGEGIMNWLRELRLAARGLLKRPGYAATASLTLSLGIGATVAIFTVVNGVLLRPLPYPDSDGLVVLEHHAPGLNLPTLNNSPGTLRFYWQEGDFLESLAGYGSGERNLIGGERPERVEILAATPSIFQVLRVQPALGRPFNEADAEEGAPPVAILTHQAWTTRFGGDPGVLGRTLEIDGTVTELVGVLPQGFAFPDQGPMAMVPLHVDPEGTFGQFGTQSVARLAPGVTLEQADRRIGELQARFPDFFPNLEQTFLDQAGWSASVKSLQTHVVGDAVASTLWIVLGTVAFVFLIACANVANLFLVRAESRQKELAIRAAMGAGYGSIASGFLAEAMLLGAVGGLAGMMLAWGGVDLLLASGPQDLPRMHEVAVDGATLAFAGLLSVLAALLFGAFPLVRYAGGALASLLRDGGRANTVGRERHRTRNALVAGQLALALILVVGSGLMFRSFQAMRSLDPGFDPDDILTVGVSLGDGVPNAEAAAFYQQVADRVAALPGVTSVALTPSLPAEGNYTNGGSFRIESKPREEGTLPPVAMYKAIGADYLKTVRQPLLQGRDLTREDWESGTPVALVNQTFADRYLDGDAIGQGIKWDEEHAFATVVGVVADARERGLREDIEPFAYLPMVVGDWGYPEMDRAMVMVRTEPGRTIPVSAVRDIVAQLNPSVPLTSSRTMDEVIAEEMAGLSFTMILLGIASVVALFLGAIGLFGVISYVVAQRTREIGVRVALGARGEDIRGMVFTQSARVALVGVTLGLAGAAALTRLMGTLLYGVSALDPLSFVAAPALLVAVAVLATWLPARRAARVSPMVALQAE